MATTSSCIFSLSNLTMNLIIDVGNTRIKLAVFNAGTLIEKVVCGADDFLDSLHELSHKFPKITHSIVSSVGKFSEFHISEVRKLYPLVILNHQVNLEYTNAYSTPKTLGVDRIALVSAAADQYQDENVLVIDAGSCITYDFLNDQNSYLGGGISPGVEMRYKAMHSFTANLPLLEKNLLENPIGDSTENAMHVGAVRGVIHEIEGFIDSYIEKVGNLTVILTGGDAHFLRDSIKNNIFANSNFLLEGLNKILEINKHTC